MNNKLFVERILDFCDVPQLFIARDTFDTIYLCLLYEDTPSCLYTAIRISNERLQNFLSGLPYSTSPHSRQWGMASISSSLLYMVLWPGK